MENAVNHRVFYISDGTTITAGALGHTIISQFSVTISSITLSFVGNKSRTRAARDQVDAIYHQTGVHPLVFYSIVLPGIRAIVLQSKDFCQGIVQALIVPLQQEMKLGPAPIAHRTHGLNPNSLSKYDAHVVAINYTLAHDGGISLYNLDQAQVILLGVSRCGKAPTSLYLAVQLGIRVTNYPFIADDMGNLVLPTSLKPLQHKLFGLAADPERLATIRGGRRGNSRYASLRRCRMEVAEVKALYRKNRILWINSASYSVEEIATKILDIMSLSRRIY